jgi:hypothetical protein
MGAGKFAAAHAARALADPEGHQLAAARAEHDRQIRKLERKFVAEKAALHRELAAAQAALRDAQIANDHLQRHLQATDAAFRNELAATRTALSDSQAENERLRRRLKECDAISRLIVAATQAESGDRL